ncbi:hypothetical protein DPMN_161023 [Dreissena polymorpha]|uniref:Uncharacterized protein n=1 Tax=Dreissena polymorpha TaxID=45954 RepID=A0A9D4IQQ1_DREPO|nr:hypothetical protein DPMN_161023 [Dreissena polymorpha]
MHYAQFSQNTTHSVALFFINRKQPASEAIKADPRANLVIRALHEDCGTYMAGRNCIAGVRVETQGESVVIQGIEA